MKITNAFVNSDGNLQLEVEYPITAIERRMVIIPARSVASKNQSLTEAERAAITAMTDDAYREDAISKLKAVIESEVNKAVDPKLSALKGREL